MKERHPVEELLNASASDILSAIQRGFRALVDVKGKLAEYFLFQKLERLREQRVIESVEWLDRDGQPDFVIGVGERTLRVECKNVRSGAEGRYRNAEGYKVELQKTRNSKDGTPTRGYRIGEFDILAACLFNQTHQWEYLYVATGALQRRANMADILVIMQRVPPGPEGPWRPDIEAAIHDALQGVGR
ncbi:hypothetical protein L6Q96_05705 [Candidatus Binatia bacterium]|nr:hypothetical protein [Candidatus Binatia bacterium]